MLATIFKSPFLGLTDEDLIALAPNRKGSLFEALGASDNPRHRKAHARIETWRDNARQLTPFFFYSQILSAERGRHAMLSRLGPEAGDAMDEFLRLALDHETREPPSLVNFLGALETIDLEVKRDMEAGANAVRVMTVHASKGLEAKIVFLADTCGLPTGRHDPKIYAVNGGQFGPVLAWSPGKKHEPQALGRAREDVRLQAEEEYRRLLYVAMTRAEERLTIAGFLGKTALKEGSWYQMIETALSSQLKDVPARWDPSEKILRRIAGDMSRLSALGPLPASLPETSLPDWIGQAAPKEAAPIRPLTPSTALAAADRLEPEPREPTSFAATAARAGRLVHGLLQHLPDLPASHRAAAAQRFLAQRADGFDAEMREKLVAQALDTLNAPLLAPLFAAGSQAEVGIGGRVNLPDGRQIDISAQIDRLAIGESEVLIADFKTGRPRLPAETPPTYLAQLALYRAALGPLYQGKQVRCFLVWTEGPVGHEVPAAMLDAALLDVQRARF
jgi:ATP-dependent helicase/nuclease subunit A